MTTRLLYWHWEEFYDKKQIKTIHDLIQDKFYGKQNPKFAASPYADGTPRKVVDTQLVGYRDIEHGIRDIIDEAYTCCLEHFGYTAKFPTNDELHYNTYTSTKKSRYDYHTDDARDTTHDYKLTLLVNLSPEEFEGGDFYLFSGGDMIIPELKKPGSAIAIKSSMHHKVTPVTKGVRRTLTHFMKGPAWT